MRKSNERPATRGDLLAFEQRLEQRLGGLDGKINSVDQKIDSAEKRLDQKISSVDQKIESAEKSLGQKISSVDQKIDSVEKSLDQKISSVEKRLDQKIDRVVVEVIKSNDRMGLMEDRLRQDMTRLNAEVTSKLDVFMGRLETIWRESAILPHVLDALGRRVDGLEGRVGALEAK